MKIEDFARNQGGLKKSTENILDNFMPTLPDDIPMTSPTFTGRITYDRSVEREPLDITMMGSVKQ